MRGSGRTQFMIDSLVEAVIAGSPTNIVFGHSLQFIRGNLYDRVIKSLEDKDMEVERVNHSRLLCEGSVILFMSTEEPIHKLRGIRGSHFVDHHCAGKYYETFMKEPI